MCVVVFDTCVVCVVWNMLVLICSVTPHYHLDCLPATARLMGISPKFKMAFGQHSASAGSEIADSPSRSERFSSYPVSHTKTCCIAKRSGSSNYLSISRGQVTAYLSIILERQLCRIKNRDIHCIRGGSIPKIRNRESRFLLPVCEMRNW